MWRTSKIKKTLVIVVCLLVGGVAGLGNIISSHGSNTAAAAPSHAYPALSTSFVTMHALDMTTRAAPFRITSIDMSVTPANVSTWRCNSYIQVVYNAVFHVVSGSNGGTIVFYYTMNNGRGQTPAKLTILPGQRMSNFVFTWQGSLPGDHTYPGRGGVLVTNPNNLVSPLVAPNGRCR